MNRPIIRFALLVSLGLAAGCGSSEPRLSLTKYDQVQSEIERVSKELDSSQAAKLKTAAEVLAMHAMMSATSEEAQALASVEALNGKTPSEVIAAYEKLGPELQLKIGQQIATARAEAPLKEARILRQKADEFNMKFSEEAKSSKNVALTVSLGKLELLYLEKLDDVGSAKASEWVLSEYEKGQGYIVEKYCPPDMPK